MKNILSRIFALWGIIVFAVTVLIVVVILLLTGYVKEPKRTRQFHSISRIWMRFFFFVTGCRLRIVGEENFKPGEKYIVTCNHNSFMDVPVATPFIPRANKTIAKAEMAKIPVFGLVYKRGSVLVDRKDKQSRQNSFRKMKEVLDLGLDMCIYPEGTRNKSDAPLKAFHDGAFRLAAETKVSIIPALLFNTKKVLPPNKTFYFWPSKMEMHFLPAVEVSDFESAELIKEKVYTLMSTYYEANRPI